MFGRVFRLDLTDSFGKREFWRNEEGLTHDVALNVGIVL
jgi:hypothetical protein